MPDRLILFDGMCNLCSFWVRFVIQRDPRKEFRFAALQSAAGQETLRRLALAGGEPHTMVFVEEGKAYLKSSAALRIARRIGGLGSLAFVFIILPAPVRDFFYDLVARNRYRWFGRKESCMVPTPDLKDRFLE